MDVAVDQRCFATSDESIEPSSAALSVSGNSSATASYICSSVRPNCFKMELNLLRRRLGSLAIFNFNVLDTSMEEIVQKGPSRCAMSSSKFQRHNYEKVTIERKKEGKKEGKDRIRSREQKKHERRNETMKKMKVGKDDEERSYCKTVKIRSEHC